jgi:hypothetical protein
MPTTEFMPPFEIGVAEVERFGESSSSTPSTSSVSDPEEGGELARPDPHSRTKCQARLEDGAKHGVHAVSINRVETYATLNP